MCADVCKDLHMFFALRFAKFANRNIIVSNFLTIFKKLKYFFSMSAFQCNLKVFQNSVESKCLPMFPGIEFPQKYVHYRDHSSNFAEVWQKFCRFRLLRSRI